MDALAGAVIPNLLVSVANLIKEEVDFILNAKDDLEELQRKLERLKKALKDADRKPFLSNERDKDLEGELKDVVYDAQDIIEEYETKIVLLNKKVHKPWIPSFKKHVSSPYQLDKEIKKINQRLDGITKDREIVDLLKKTTKESGAGHVSGEHGNPRETTHHMGSQPPIGREHDKETVKKLLLDGPMESSVPREKHAGVSIISIVGQGGIGKTTLAKMVFDDDEVKEQFGEHRLWVCVSERPDREGLLRKILREALKGSAGVLEGNTSLNDLCTQLKSVLSRERFLLVLDDIWDLGWWSEEVEGTLMGGSMGSKILITSRNQDVSIGMNASYMHKLPELTFDESWTLFLKMATNEENELVSHHLEDIGKRIVKKCGGLPLVVRTVGSLMRTKKMKKEDWEYIENSGIWAWKKPASSSSNECGDIIPGLMLSYDDLPSYLRSCFVYCSIFPKDYEIKRGELVMQWVAHGLIDKNNDSDVEVIADQYIYDLTRRCLIEETVKGDLKLHDSLHDLALYIGGNEYSHASVTEHTRHLSLLGALDGQVPSAAGGENKLRTLLIYTPLDLANVACFTNLKWLRVLSLRWCTIHELPNSIGHLSLLRYLDLSRSKVRKLPTSIGGLCNLHMLNLNYSEIEELPKEMGGLCNLRFLGLEGTKQLSFVAEGLGKLSNLRTLEKFLVCCNKKSTRGCNIKELKTLNKLKGKLSIKGLGITRKDAEKAPQLLQEKSGLSSLELDFRKMGKDGKVASASEQRSVLEALEPPRGLERLEICHFQGRMPAWSLQSNYAMLQYLIMVRCPLWTKVISIDSLKSLCVIECGSLEQLPDMPALEELWVFQCGSLEQVADMPSLKRLSIRECNGLRMLGNMPALEELEVFQCGSLEQVPDMPSLKWFTIRECNGLRMLGNMPALKQLYLSECGIGIEKVADMPYLEWLRIRESNGLSVITVLF